MQLWRGVGGRVEGERQVFMLLTPTPPPPARDTPAAGHVAEGPVLGAPARPAGPGGAGRRLPVPGLGLSQ